MLGTKTKTPDLTVEKKENLGKSGYFLEQAKKLLGKDRFAGLFVDHNEKNIFMAHVLVPKQVAPQGQQDSRIDIADWARIMEEQKVLKRRLIGVVYSHRTCGVYLHNTNLRMLQEMNRQRQEKLFLMVINNAGQFAIFFETDRGIG